MVGDPALEVIHGICAIPSDILSMRWISEEAGLRCHEQNNTREMRAIKQDKAQSALCPFVNVDQISGIFSSASDLHFKLRFVHGYKKKYYDKVSWLTSGDETLTLRMLASTMAGLSQMVSINMGWTLQALNRSTSSCLRSAVVLLPSRIPT